MAVKSSKIIEFDIMSEDGVREEQIILPSKFITLSDDMLIELIIKQLPLKRRYIARNQIKIYFNKIMSNPEMRLEYIRKIKQLVISEKNFNKNRVDLDNE